MKGRDERKLVRGSAEPVTLTLNRRLRDPGRVALRRAESPARSAGQGCSPAVAPARPLRGLGGCLGKQDGEGPANGVVRNLNGAFPWN